jgi:hypothetical protein
MSYFIFHISITVDTHLLGRQSFVRIWLSDGIEKKSQTCGVMKREIRNNELANVMGTSLDSIQSLCVKHELATFRPNKIEEIN